MKTELLVNFAFTASHSLGGYEEPHPHLWSLEVGVCGELVDGKIVDMMDLRFQIEALIKPLCLTYLNENLEVSESVRRFPTCETLSEYFAHKIQDTLTQSFKSENPTVSLSSVCMGISEVQGKELGKVRRSLLSHL